MTCLILFNFLLNKKVNNKIMFYNKLLHTMRYLYTNENIYFIPMKVYFTYTYINAKEIFLLNF